MKWWTSFKNMDKQKRHRWYAKWLLVSVGSVMLCFCGILLLAKLMGPPELLVPQTAVLYDRNGTALGEIQNGGQNRYWVPLSQIDPNVIKATLAVEDRNFYNHHGFDFKRIAGALLADLKAGSKVQGASTITQQYARNLFLTHDKTWNRKFQEAFYTLRLEMNYSKNQILEGYLNTIYYGHGAYGIQSAAHYYLNKSTQHLTLGEAAMLAGIPKGPSYYSPISHMNRAKSRQLIILGAMKKQGIITAAEQKSAAKETIAIKPMNVQDQPVTAPYFQDAVMRVLKNDLHINPNSLQFGGLHIYTTLDKQMQQIAESTIAQQLNGTELQTAFVAMDPRNGEVRALVGGVNYAKSPYNRAIQARRAPGSTFKPFLYYAALQSGYTPSTLLKSEPTAFAMGDGKPDYEPHNFDNRYANNFITMAQALAVSDNIYAVKTNIFLGPEKLVDTARQFGITSPLASIPSLALGSKGVGVTEMTNAYNLFANGGKQVEPVFVTKITDREGRVIYENKEVSKQVLDPASTYVMTDMMKGMFDERLNGYTSVTGSTIDQTLTRPMAGKSGSTPNDSWMIGFAPQLNAGVWVGYDKGKELRQIDSGYSKRIWARFMESALKNEPVLPFHEPGGVVAVTVDPRNGKLAAPNSPVKRLSYYVKGTEPTDYSTASPQPAAAKKPPQKSWLERLFPWW